MYLFNFLPLNFQVRSYGGVVGGAMVLGKLQCWGALLTYFIVAQGQTVLAVFAGGDYLDIFLPSIISLFFSLNIFYFNKI